MPKEWETEAGIFATTSTVERLHQENKISHAQMMERVGELEKEFAVIDEKLTTIRVAVEALKPKGWLSVLPIILSVLLPSVGVAYLAGTYPTKTDLAEVRGRINAAEIENAMQRATLDIFREELRALRRGP